MVRPLLEVVAPRTSTPAGEVCWTPLAEQGDRVPASLVPWLAEPGLLTARVRRECGADTRLRLLKLEPAPLAPSIALSLGVDDPACYVREIEFTCDRARWIFAQSVFPQSTVQRYPWLKELGENGLGESLSVVDDVRREPLEYLELGDDHPLARAAEPMLGAGETVWARRAVYRLGGWPILVQEVFLPALVRRG